MGISFRKFFTDAPLEMASIHTVLSPMFDEISVSVGALCGVTVLSVDGSIPFEEVSAFGYENESHFYSFLNRGGGQFEMVKNSDSACIFLSDSFKLYSPFAKFAIVQRIGDEKNFLGFILWEFSGDVKDLYSDFLLLFSSQLYSRILGGKTPKNQKNNVNFECIDLVVKSTPGLQGKFIESKDWDYFLISGAAGTGKKTFAKYILHSSSAEKNAVILNSIPEQIVKLEKSLADWTELSDHGMIIFENIHEFSLAQQRFFFEKFSENLDSVLVFLDSKLPKKEIYPPFWEALNQRTINLPDLDSMEKNHFTEILKSLFREISFRQNKKDSVLTDDAINSLKFGNYPQNFHELKNILEHSIVTAISEKIGLEDVVVNSKVRLKSIGEQDSEDLNIRRCVAALERQKILLANRLFSGNQIRMAKALGISRGSLQYKMKKMELL